MDICDTKEEAHYIYFMNLSDPLEFISFLSSNLLIVTFLGAGVSSNSVTCSVVLSQDKC